MAKSKDPAAYSEVYYQLFNTALSRPEGHTLRGLSFKEAQSLRFDLYGFRSALVSHDLDIGRHYQGLELIIEKAEHCDDATLHIRNANHSPRVNLIRASLNALPPTEELLAEMGKEYPEPEPSPSTEMNEAQVEVLRKMGIITTPKGD